MNQNQNQNTMDVRTFFGKTAAKTETKTPPPHPDQKYCERCGMPNGLNPPIPLCDVCEEEDVAFCEGFRRGLEAGSKEDKSKNDLAQEEAYREGLKEGRAEGHSELLNDWEFNPTLRDLANGCPPMSKMIGGELYFRHMTDEEENSLYFEGPVIKFPVRWDRGEVTYDERHIFQKDWDKGERWTLGRVWKFAKAIYSKNKQKAVKEMGDHQFWEGIDKKTGEVYCGS